MRKPNTEMTKSDAVWKW